MYSVCRKKCFGGDRFSCLHVERFQDWAVACQQDRIVVETKTRHDPCKHVPLQWPLIDEHRCQYNRVSDRWPIAFIHLLYTPLLLLLLLLLQKDQKLHARLQIFLDLQHSRDADIPSFNVLYIVKDVV